MRRLRVWLSPILMIAATARGGAPPPSVPTYGEFEAPVPVELGGRSPFDPDAVSVVGVFEHETGKRFLVPGFWFQGYGYSVDGAARAETLRPDGPPGFRVRFSPPMPGRYAYRFEVTSEGQTRVAGRGALGATKPRTKGPLRRVAGRRYLENAMGEPVFLIGHNVAWSTDKAPLDDLLRYVREMAASGQNCLRLWHCTWCLGFEHEATGRYDLERAWKLDRLLAECERRGVTVILCLDNAYDVREKKSPYWRGPGAIRAKHEFFTAESARRAFRNRIRYAAARWGASAALGAWELMNEMEYAVLGPLELDSSVRDRYFRPWTTEMAAHVRRWDAHGHLLTASLAVDRVWDGLYAMPWLDIAQHHCYLNDWDTDGAAKVLRNLAHMRDAGKPYLLGEFGGAEAGVYGATGNVVHKADPVGVHLHNALWASALSGACGTPLHWWWDSYIRPRKLYPHYAALAAFHRGTQPWSQELRPVDLSTPEVRVLALRSEARIILWAQNREATWENAAKLDQLEPTAATTVRLDGFQPGVYRVEWWDTRTGKVVRTREVGAMGGAVRLEIPALRIDAAAFVCRVNT